MNTHKNGLSPKIIRVWFDTILNPMIEGLEIEIDYLNKSNLTWRGFNNSFQELKPLFNFCNYRYHANLDQSDRYYPIILETIEKHDNKLALLEESCLNLFSVLKNSQILKDLYNEKVKEILKNNSEITDSRINDFKDENNYRYIAEYIINNRDNLDSGYTLSPIWNSFKDIFKNLLNDDTFKSLFQNQQTALTQFKEAVNKSLSDLKELRNKLSIQYGEPIVMPIED